MALSCTESQDDGPESILVLDSRWILEPVDNVGELDSLFHLRLWMHAGKS